MNALTRRRSTLLVTIEAEDRGDAQGVGLVSHPTAQRANTLAVGARKRTVARMIDHATSREGRAAAGGARERRAAQAPVRRARVSPLTRSRTARRIPLGKALTPPWGHPSSQALLPILARSETIAEPIPAARRLRGLRLES